MADGPSASSGVLAGKQVALVGRLASMPRRDAFQLIRSHGATPADAPHPGVHLIVIGEKELPVPEGGLEEWFDAATAQAAEAGRIEVLTESQLWQRLGLVEPQLDIQRLYTPSMLAELLHVPVAVIRRWHRRGLIVPAREVRRLPYFDFQEVATARRLAELLAAGVSPRVIEKKLEALLRYVPDVERPLAQLSIIVQGKEILLRQGDGLVEPGGQLRFDFEARALERPIATVAAAHAPEEAEPSATSPEQLSRAAAELEEAGELEAAAEMYRAAMAAGGPAAETCFQLAEVLYRLGDRTGARERYYMAIELDEDYVEARANLGCVLTETGQKDLALAAFQGALKYHPDYADVHYHLARLLDETGQGAEALGHWRAFLELAPDSPWADEARARVNPG